MEVDRETTAVVGDPDAAVGEQHHVDGVAVSGERLVDRVVDDLPDEVVQTALAGGPDVHTGPLADRLQTLENGDRLCAVLLLVLRCHPRPLSRVSHAGRARRARVRRTGRDVGARTGAGDLRTAGRTRRSPRLPADRDRLDPTWRMNLGPPAPSLSHTGSSSRCQSYCARGTEPPLGTLREAAEMSVAGRTPPPATPPTRQGPIARAVPERVDPRPGGSGVAAEASVPYVCGAPEPALIFTGRNRDDRPDRPDTCSLRGDRWGWTTSRCTGRGPAASTIRSRRPSSSTSARSSTCRESPRRPPRWPS